MEIKNRDIVVIGIQPWDIEIGSNCKNIALEFSKITGFYMSINHLIENLKKLRRVVTKLKKD
jgi:hypothetical protein